MQAVNQAGMQLARLACYYRRSRLVCAYDHIPTSEHGLLFALSPVEQSSVVFNGFFLGASAVP